MVAAWRLRGSQARIRRATESEYRQPQEVHWIEQQRRAEQQALQSPVHGFHQAVICPGALQPLGRNLRWAADEVHDWQAWIGACPLNEGVVAAFGEYSHEVGSVVLQHDECTFPLGGVTHEIEDWRQVGARHRSFWSGLLRVLIRAARIGIAARRPAMELLRGRRKAEAR